MASRLPSASQPILIWATRLCRTVVPINSSSRVIRSLTGCPLTARAMATAHTSIETPALPPNPPPT